MSVATLFKTQHFSDMMLKLKRLSISVAKVRLIDGSNVEFDVDIFDRIKDPDF